MHALALLAYDTRIWRTLPVKEVTGLNLYPNLYALLESNSNARRLFERAPSHVRRQLLVRQQSIHSVAALDAAIAACQL